MNNQDQHAKLHRKSDIQRMKAIPAEDGPMTNLTLTVRNDCLTVIDPSPDNADFSLVVLRVPACDPEQLKSIVEQLKVLRLPEYSIDGIMDHIREELAIECLREMVKSNYQ